MQNTKLVFPLNDPGLLSPRSLVLFPRRVTKAGGILGKLCIKCGGYSGSNHEHCMQCVEKLKKTNPFQRDYWENTKKSPKSKTTPRTLNKTDPNKTSGKFCFECKSSVSMKSELCLICDAKKRGRMRERTMLHFNLIFGDGDIIRSYASSGLSGESIKSDSRVIGSHPAEMLDSRHNLSRLKVGKTKDAQSVDVVQELEKCLNEAEVIKNEFLAAKMDSDEQKWGDLFREKRESLEQKEQTVQKLPCNSRREKDKQDETKGKIQNMLKKCQEHFAEQKMSIPEEEISEEETK